MKIKLKSKQIEQKHRKNTIITIAKSKKQDNYKMTKFEHKKQAQKRQKKPNRVKSKTQQKF